MTLYTDPMSGKERIYRQLLSMEKNILRKEEGEEVVEYGLDKESMTFSIFQDEIALRRQIQPDHHQYALIEIAALVSRFQAQVQLLHLERVGLVLICFFSRRLDKFHPPPPI